MNAKWLKCQSRKKNVRIFVEKPWTIPISLSRSLSVFVVAHNGIHSIYSTTDVEIMMDDSFRSIFHDFEMNFWSPAFSSASLSALPPSASPLSVLENRMTTSFNYTFQLKRELIRLHFPGNTQSHCIMNRILYHIVLYCVLLSVWSIRMVYTEHTKKEHTFE